MTERVRVNVFKDSIHGRHIKVYSKDGVKWNFTDHATLKGHELPSGHSVKEIGVVFPGRPSQRHLGIVNVEDENVLRAIMNEVNS